MTCWEQNPVEATVDVVVTRAEWSALEQSGWSIAVIDRARPLMEALQGKADIAASPAAATPRKAGAAPSSGLAAGAPLVGAALVPATYLDLDGILGRMHEIAQAHQGIAQVVDLTATYQAPPTIQGRHMFALKISDNVAVDEDETAMLICHHAPRAGDQHAGHRARSRQPPDRRLQRRRADHCGRQQPRVLDRAGLESGWLQLRLHRRQLLEEEPPGLRHRRRRGPEPQLSAGMVDVVRGQHHRDVGNL